MGALNKYGSNPGALGPVVVIGPVNVPAANDVEITDFGGTVQGTVAATTTLELQGSTDSFVGSIVALDRIEIPTNGTVLKTYESPIHIPKGRQFRVLATQGVIGAFSCITNGETTGIDIRDLP